MNRSILSFLLCPECAAQELHLEEYSHFEKDTSQIIDGRLICPKCANWYRIENGIVDLLPIRLRQSNFERFEVKNIRFAEKYDLVSCWPMSTHETSKTSDKTKPIGAFEDVANYEQDVVNNGFYKALDQLAFFEWMKQNLKEGDRVLDIGCGSGRQCVPLAEREIYAIGIDIDEDMLLLASKKIREKSLESLVDLIIADGENPPVRENCFVGCILYGVLHHLSNKKDAVYNASAKLMDDGKIYTLDPHKSFARFIFDFLMKIWKLYVEEASDDPLITEKQILLWMKESGIVGNTRLSTYVPPHIFVGSMEANIRLLKITDKIFSGLPWIRKAGGVIIFEGKKEPITGKMRES
jgi:ubiquinone/menaquinone biosynthesis C-methylase UbiE/uncharacterized protein YbaR (Trm112 family)